MQVSIGFFLEQEEKDLLDAIAERNGRASKSAMLRKLITDEAQRQGITLNQPIESAPQASR
jgi:hypothetical protein